MNIENLRDNYPPSKNNKSTERIDVNVSRSTKIK
jgi:hypothetical protein|nr:MAG TPA: hypothetical protein [Caudoviricetes sp.]DAO45400.1 MAG TPA: hypothetical protein [Caudoviricetes sp.]DAX27201.1 MAG TPA: hypothetical protein [Caudoviricetes sp.]DAZ35320.1 MAG TPA: hypothetical protein [Caudoviricetes sp.]